MYIFHNKAYPVRMLNIERSSQYKTHWQNSRKFKVVIISQHTFVCKLAYMKKKSHMEIHKIQHNKNDIDM